MVTPALFLQLTFFVACFFKNCDIFCCSKKRATKWERQQSCVYLCWNIYMTFTFLIHCVCISCHCQSIWSAFSDMNHLKTCWACWATFALLWTNNYYIFIFTLLHFSRNYLSGFFFFSFNLFVWFLSGHCDQSPSVKGDKTRSKMWFVKHYFYLRDKPQETEIEIILFSTLFLATALVEPIAALINTTQSQTPDFLTVKHRWIPGENETEFNSKINK